MKSHREGTRTDRTTALWSSNEIQLCTSSAGTRTSTPSLIGEGQSSTELFVRNRVHWLLLACPAWLLFGLEHGSGTFLHNVCELLPDYTAFQKTVLFVVASVRASHHTCQCSKLTCAVDSRLCVGSNTYPLYRHVPIIRPRFPWYKLPIRLVK
jgi:hypothetical protein